MAPENSLSAGDIQRTLKKFELQGIHVKYIIIDYLDVLKPTLSLTGSVMADEYLTLGVKYDAIKSVQTHFRRAAQPSPSTTIRTQRKKFGKI